MSVNGTQYLNTSLMVHALTGKCCSAVPRPITGLNGDTSVETSEPVPLETRKEVVFQ